VKNKSCPFCKKDIDEDPNKPKVEPTKPVENSVEISGPRLVIEEEPENSVRIPITEELVANHSPPEEDEKEEEVELLRKK
jgi:hypothetical protein